jgi:hypothetical protein
LESVHDGFRVIVKGMTTAVGFVSMSALYLALFLDSIFSEFGCHDVVFLFTEFPLRQQISCLFYFSAFKIFCCTQTHTWLLDVIILFFIFSYPGDVGRHHPPLRTQIPRWRPSWNHPILRVPTNAR